MPGSAIERGPIMYAELRWVSGVTCEAEGMGGATLRVDQPVDQGGTGHGFRPMELLLHALAASLVKVHIR